MNEDIDFVFHELNICSCGDTDGQMMFIKKYLTLMNDFKYMNPEVIELIKDSPEAVYEILGHFLANEDIVEYGSSIRGCWLTDKGKQLLKRIGEHSNFPFKCINCSYENNPFPNFKEQRDG